MAGSLEVMIDGQRNGTSSIFMVACSSDVVVVVKCDACCCLGCFSFNRTPDVYVVCNSDYKL
jgi:hypothetical protein